MLLVPLLLLPRALAREVQPVAMEVPLVAMEVPPVAMEVAAATTAQPATATGSGRKRRAGGKYTVQEEVMVAPGQDHPCRLTNTSVRITFPGMKSEVYVSFLGYREPSIVYLPRCQGQCDTGPSLCRPTASHTRQLKMLLRAELTGGEARVREQEVRLEEHLECECACPAEEEEACSGRPGSAWDPAVCACVARVVERGVEAQQQYSHCTDLAQLYAYRPRPRYRGLDIAGWVLLGSCISLVFILAATTWHYRKKARLVKEAQQQQGSRTRPIQTKKRPKEQSKGRFAFNKEPSRLPPTRQAQLRDMNFEIENTMLLNNGGGGGELYHEQYNEHGVRIENQCFP